MSVPKKTRMRYNIKPVPSTFVTYLWLISKIYFML